MAQIILDAGSGNTCRNSKPYIKRMYDELKAVDTGKHEVIVKWQLFEKAGDNTPLTHECFEYAYEYGTSLGYKVTSSVFNKNSLDFLLDFDVPFVKIANNRALDWLIGEVPRKIPIYASRGQNESAALWGENRVLMCCISKYPAELIDYGNTFNGEDLHKAVSDHTTTFDLWNAYMPQIIEWHYRLQDSIGLDAGPFARTSEQLKEIL